MPCRGICALPGQPWKTARRARYAFMAGRKHCRQCDIAYIGWDGTLCPCCSTMLRTAPRGRRSTREKYRAQRGGHGALWRGAAQ